MNGRDVALFVIGAFVLVIVAGAVTVAVRDHLGEDPWPTDYGLPERRTLDAPTAVLWATDALRADCLARGPDLVGGDYIERIDPGIGGAVAFVKVRDRAWNSLSTEGREKLVQCMVIHHGAETGAPGGLAPLAVGKVGRGGTVLASWPGPAGEVVVAAPPPTGTVPTAEQRAAASRSTRRNFTAEFTGAPPGDDFESCRLLLGVLVQDGIIGKTRLNPRNNRIIVPVDGAAWLAGPLALKQRAARCLNYAGSTSPNYKLLDYEFRDAATNALVARWPEYRE